MKFNFNKTSLILTLSLLSFQSFGQELKPDLPDPPTEKSNQKEVVYDFVDEPADFPGGREALLNYLSDNIVYPDRALKN